MRVDLDARVRTRDGEDAGSVERAVFDPDTNDVTDFVVSTGTFLGRDVLVPRAELERATADGDALRLALSKDELERLPDYVPTNYVVPPAEWAMPIGYGFGPGGFVWPAAYAGAMADVPEGERAEDEPISLAKGAVVFDRDGHDIGVVDDVRFDQDSGHLRGFVLRVGGALRTLFGGGETAEVASSQVDRVDEGSVTLRVLKEDLRKAA